MSTVNQPSTQPFVDRRQAAANGPTGLERRQFSNSYSELSADAQELARAIDGYKLNNRRRFITYEEMLGVLHDLGYEKRNA